MAVPTTVPEMSSSRIGLALAKSRLPKPRSAATCTLPKPWR